NHLHGHAPQGRPGPRIQADPRRLRITEIESRLVHALSLGDGPAQVAQAIQAGGDLVAGDVDFPVVAGPLQEPHRLPALLNALAEPGAGVEDDAVEVQRLPLPPDVA